MKFFKSVIFALISFFFIQTVYAEQFLVYPFQTNQDSIITNTFDGHASYCGGCQGTDYGVSYGKPLYAAMSGTVTVEDGHPDKENAQGCNEPASYGNSVKITNGSWEVIYGHMANGRMQIANGSSVRAGQLIGYSSNSGYTCGTDVNGSGYHLHFEVQYNFVDKNPYTQGYFIKDSDGSYKYPSETSSNNSSSGGSSSGDSDSTSSTSPQVIMAEVNATSTYYDIYTWYYKNDVLNIISNSPVQDTNPYSVSNTKKWFSGKIKSGDYDDILTSFTHANYRDGDDYRLFYVYNSNGNGDFDGDGDVAVKWKEKKESNVDKVFLSDADNDGLADLILSNKNSDGEYEWKICTNEGGKFEDDCADWVSSEDGGTFGEADDVMIAGDFNGNGKVELIRGRFGTEDCSDGLKWRRMTSEGNVSTVKDCWGYLEEVASGGTYKSQYLVGNIDSDVADELIQIRISNSGSVQAYKANFNSDTGDFDTSSWTAEGSTVDIGGATGWYYLADVDNDGDGDLVRWSAEGNIVWMKNENGVLKKAKNTLKKNRSRGDDDTLLFGNFGEKSSSTSGATFFTASVEESSDYSSNDTEDSDEDGLADSTEYWLESDSWDEDTDDDSFSDYFEFHIGSDVNEYTYPSASLGTEGDSDGDGLSDEIELELGSDPLDFDTDDDGYSDYDEVTDSDGDGLINAKELSLGTNPDFNDSDVDGITDYQEYIDFLYSSYSVGGTGCSFRVE